MLQMIIASAIPRSPPTGPAGRKNSASSRPVAYPPPITTALKASPGSNTRLMIEGSRVLTAAIAVRDLSPVRGSAARARKSGAAGHVLRRGGSYRLSPYQGPLEEVSGGVEVAHPRPPHQRVVSLVGEHDQLIRDVVR